MPQLDKFTYFTPFFWFCLFLFTVYIGKKFVLPFHLQEKLYLLYLTNSRFRQIVFFFKFCFFFFILTRTSFLLIQTIKILLAQQAFYFGILPSEIDLLEFYLNQPHQDPEWVEFVRQRLETPSLSPRAYEVMVRDFLNTELCFSTREQICSMYKQIFYGREDPKFFIDPIDLDCILHVSIERIEFHHSALSEILKNLCTEGHDSPFYSEVKTTQTEHFRGFLNLKRKTQLDLQQQEEMYNQVKSMEKKISFLKNKNTYLRERISILDSEGKAGP